MALKDAPEKLKPYLFHGLELDWSGTNDAKGDCPFCGKEQHFFVSQEAGLWSCKVCAEGSERGGGNIYTFLQAFWEYCKSYCYKEEEYESLAEERGLRVRTLIEWGVVKSALRGEWMIPGFNLEKKVTNLYRWATLKTPEGPKKRLLGTPGLNQSLFGLHLFNQKVKQTRIQEGPWDGMAVYEALASVREVEGKIVRTADKRHSLLKGCNILAVPGCEQFNERWAGFVKGHKVFLFYDNDYPRKNKQTGGLNPPAGYRGMERATNFLSPYTKDIEVVDWGPDGFNKNLPNGFDARDAYAKFKATGLWANIPFSSPPENWLRSIAAPKAADGSSIEPIETTSYAEVVSYWKKALKWTEVMDATLSFMFAICAGTDMKSHSDAVWGRVQGPPGSAKSTLCEAFSISHHTFPTSIQRGFHSGYTGKKPGTDEEDDAENKDSSLIPLIKNRTVIIKDGDTLLTAPNRDQTLAELRDIYDGTSRAHYRNKKASVYKGINTTFILAGTRTLRKLNRSYLGDRFLDCIIYDRAEGNPELEDEILSRAAFGALNCMREVADGSEEGLVDAKVLEAWKHTAGYLNWLRHIESNGKPRAHNLLAKLKCPDVIVHTCRRLGEYVSYMRARPDKDSEDDDEVELATRLTRQFVRLANQTAVIMNKEVVDEEVMERVVKIAKDTSRGLTLKAVECLSTVKNGIDGAHLALMMKKDKQQVLKHLKFLHTIDVVRPYRRPNNSGARGRHRNLWELVPKLKELQGTVSSYRTITTAAKRVNGVATSLKKKKKVKG